MGTISRKAKPHPDIMHHNVYSNSVNYIPWTSEPIIPEEMETNVDPHSQELF